MKKNTNGRGILILFVLGLSIFSLIPSWQVHSLSSAEKEAYIKANPKVANKAINFGLDLAGGTNIVLKVDKSGLKPDEAEDVQERALEIVRNRVDQFGLSEPNIMPSGEDRIVADLAGVNAEDARELVGSTAKLEFKLVVEQDKFVNVLNAIDNNLKSRLSAKETFQDSLVSGEDSLASADSTTVVNTDQAKADSVAQSQQQAEEALALLGVAQASIDSVSADTVAKDSADTSAVAATDSAEEDVKLAKSANDMKDREFSSMLVQFGGDIAIREADLPKVMEILAMPAIQALIPRDLEFVWGRGFEELDNGDKVKKLFALKRRAEMDGKEISDANPQRIADGLSAGQIAVNLKFKGIGPKKFATVTGNNVGRQLAIVLDKQVISAPVIQDRIANGSAQITGLEDMTEAKQLAVILRAGALPAPMEIIELRSVGATLGEDNINRGINAMLLGLLLVVGFVILYYKGAGVIAFLALAFNIVIIGAVMSMFHATLTLPGIAGVILTIGMAVDANVIIFERIREELASGKTARSSIAAGYEKAFSTIFDANITTFLTAFILYKIGSGPIKGFGLTLMIGIAASLFTALTVTRYIFDTRLKDNATNQMSIGKGLRFLNEANFNILQKARPMAMLSIVLVVASILLLPTVGLNVGIDFTGGHVITVQYADDATTSEVRKHLTDGGIQNATVRTVGVDNRFLISLAEDKGREDAARVQVENALTQSGATFEVMNEEIVGPSIGSELRKDAMWAIFWSLLLIILYIWVRFGKYGLGFGVGAVVALTHDVIITLGLFVVFGKWLELDAAIIAAILTIVGYSLNDTIVVFDRIRENTELLGKDSYESRVNLSVNQSLSRTFITSITTLFVTSVLWIFGGSSIRDFAVAMTIGVLVGTYSSIFIASPFVVWWSKRFAMRR
jgi:SecD/SecF fusion protein